ncbi:hypothetical protein GBF38_019624 [Nibea albiflora]|uniref:Uncharacterized protein n=1 Tax=Nibea albiflora TaxID=240163 RepID=A0ACB7F2W0_NIBAL|nr:hypothetical protein GBF38_019624 [Nibea albiflora]
MVGGGVVGVDLLCDWLSTPATDGRECHVPRVADAILHSWQKQMLFVSATFTNSSYSDPFPLKKHVPVGGRQEIVVILISNLSGTSKFQTKGTIISVEIPGIVQLDNRQQLHRDKSIYLDPQEATQ